MFVIRIFIYLFYYIFLMQNIVVRKLGIEAADKLEVEVVERKCKGHPDSICDGLSEAASNALSKYYLKRFGAVLHHNVDKALLVAGLSKPKFGGGKIRKIIKVIIAGRAIDRVGWKLIPVRRIVVDSAKEYLRKNLRVNLKNIRIVTEISSGSSNLQEVFSRKSHVPLSNDTSMGVGYAPFSKTEKIVLKVSDLLSSKGFLRKYPSVGDDVKIMAVRHKKKIRLTIAIAFIDKYIKSIHDYAIVKDKVRLEILKLDRNIDVIVNTLDDLNGIDESSIYLTVSGLSAEHGDDGETGRGNRINGLITPQRGMTMEAVAGKNAVSHVGKIYNVMAFDIAEEVYKKCSLKEAHVTIVSKIGKPIDEPQIVDIAVKGKVDAKKRKKIKNIVARHMANISSVTKRIISGKINVF